jgi:hypothetical protein
VHTTNVTDGCFAMSAPRVCLKQIRIKPDLLALCKSKHRGDLGSHKMIGLLRLGHDVLVICIDCGFEWSFCLFVQG